MPQIHAVISSRQSQSFHAYTAKLKDSIPVVKVLAFILVLC